MKIRKHHVENFNHWMNNFDLKYRSIGDGCNSIVYKNKDRSSVIKLTNDEAYLLYLYEAILKYKNIHFPKIYEIVNIVENNKCHETVIVMERLYNRKNINNKTTKKIIKVSYEKEKDLELSTDEDYPDSFNECAKILNKLQKKYHLLSYDIDLTAHQNIMFRKNGELVIIDPFYWMG